jgi:dolichyl-phosphate beta-glucosyltransferase
MALDWSVVIPAYNEVARLPRYLEEIVVYFDGRGVSYEVLVANDGSTDGTANVVTAIGRLHPAIRLLDSSKNEGKGAAVRRGMLSASGAYRLFTDADGATPITELKRLEVALATGAEVAIGSRGLIDPGVAVRARPHRVAAGRVFNWLVKRLGLVGIADSQCGFKAFVAGAAEDLFARVSTAGYGFDVELLLLAQARGYRVVEVPVNWTDRAGSKSRVLRDGPRMLVEIVRARRRLARQR